MYMQQKLIKETKTRPRRARYLIFIGTVAVCLSLTLGGFPSGQLLAIGQKAAMLSVAIMQPEGGVQALSERLERGSANKNNSGQKEAVKSDSSAEYVQSPDITIPESSGVIPAEAGDGGKVIEEQMTIGSNFVDGIAIKNASSATINVDEQYAIAPNLNLAKSSDPQVLIVHTHTTEAYMTYYAGYFNAVDTARSTDTTRSVVAVGDAISDELRTAGIGVIHDTTIHDQPYTGAYDRSAATIEKNLKLYPTIRVVLDIHRDALNQSDNVEIKPTAVINGRKAAQMMIIASCCDSASMPHPNWHENLRFALRLQNALNTQYEGIVRPLYLVDSRYNEHLTNGSLLIEIGSEANTVSEAVYSGEILGKTLSQVLESLMG